LEILSHGGYQPMGWGYRLAREEATHATQVVG